MKGYYTCSIQIIGKAWYLQIWGYTPERQISIKRADMIFYPVDTCMGVVCSTEVSFGQKTLHFRSIVQVKYMFVDYHQLI